MRKDRDAGLTTLPSKALGEDSKLFSSLRKPNGEVEVLRGVGDPLAAIMLTLVTEGAIYRDAVGCSV